MKIRRGLGIALLGAGLAVVSCSADRGSAYVGADASTSTASAVAVVESGAAAARIAELRARFRLPVRAPEDDRPGLVHAAPAKPVVRSTRAALGAPVATRFEAAAGADGTTHVRAVLPAEALRGVTRAAHVALPVRADGEVRLEDDTSHVSVGFVLEHVQDARIEVAGGMAIYRGALDCADVVHRVHAEGTEDFVVFETRPAREELSYSVDVSRVPGLRLVSNTLEFLDEGGTPVLRVAPPYVVDAMGMRHEAKLEVGGCAYDANPAGPWGRAVTQPGAARCAVSVAWGGGVAYPAMVDPAWGATGSMATARMRHSASVLLSGLVLVAGGSYLSGSPVYLASAELFDPGGNAGAGTFAATGSMASARELHTANVLASGKVLVVGGYGGGSNVLASAALYDPGVGAFAATGSMATARESHTASRLPAGKVLIAGGWNAIPHELASAELFDPAGNAGAGAFVATGSMATARNQHTASVLPSGKVLVAGGAAAGVGLASAELFDPAGNAGAGTFAATGSMATARGHHTASVLLSGKILVAGGSDPYGNFTQASAELFDPAGNAGAGTFAATGSMATARYQHTASALPSGKVLVAGGNSSGSGALASAEIFDPAGNAGVGTFAATGFMATARYVHTSSVLPSGQALIAGGYGGSNVYLASAELFAVQAAGATCAAGGDCVSGACRGGVCCSGPCSGACKACTAGTGACVAVKSADDLDTCTTAHTCDVSGACKLKLGQACPGGNGDCASAQCVDGYCCNSACSGGCDRCDLGGQEGTCSVLPLGDPGGNPACVAYLCDGVNAPCPTSCASDAACAANYYCAANGTCQPQKAQASACNTLADCKQSGCHECTSGNCVDGLCCDTACNGFCQACAAALKQNGVADGTCGPTKDGLDPRNECAPSGVLCGADGQCNGGGACRLYTPTGVSCGAGTCQGTLAQGQLCNGGGTCATNPVGVECAPYRCANGGCTTTCVTTSDCAGSAWCKAGTCTPKGSNGNVCPSAEACSSGFCADGVCCDKACTGQCEACDSFAGTCGPISGAPHGGRTACPTGFVCDSATATCGPPAASATCDGDHTTTGTDGTKKDCAPYKCDSNGACQKACTSVNDCVAPTICDPTGKCVPPAATGSDGGCAISAVGGGAGDSSSRLAWLAAAAGLVFARLRRRKGVEAGSR